MNLLRARTPDGSVIGGLMRHVMTTLAGHSRLKWFGRIGERHWGPFPLAHVPTPKTRCAHCGDPILSYEHGIVWADETGERAWHAECFEKDE